MKIKILNQQAVEESLDMVSVIEKVEEVYKLKADNNAGIWPIVFHEFNPGVADMDIKSGYINGPDIYGLKAVSWFGDNSKKNLPALIGTTLVFDIKTGAPIGLLSAEHVTGMRTGAAGAIGAKFLARKNSENLLMVGAGHQASFQIAATLIAMDNIKKVRVCDPLNVENSKKFVSEIKKVLENSFLSRLKDNKALYENVKSKFEVEFMAVESLERGVRESDVIITATPSRKPMIMKEWVKEGTHLSCVGSDMPGKQEIDGNILVGAKIFVDDLIQAKNVGEIEIPLKEGIISEKDICGEIGQLILGKSKGRATDKEITVFDSTGIALQDLLVSKLALDTAKNKNIGQEVNL